MANQTNNMKKKYSIYISGNDGFCVKQKVACDNFEQAYEESKKLLLAYGKLTIEVIEVTEICICY